MKKPFKSCLLFVLLFSLLCAKLPLTAYANAAGTVTYDSFDFRRYADDYADLMQAFGYNKQLLWNHYLEWGYAEGRTVYLEDGTQGTLRNAQEGLNKTNFDYRRYADDYPDIKGALGYNRKSLWKHYVEHGSSEGRFAYIGTTKSKVYRASEGQALASADPLPDYWNTRSYSEAEKQMIKSYYGTTLFIGDSVLSGFGMVCSGNADPMLSSFRFMAAPSYSLVHALNEKNGGLHPLFRGQRMPSWKVVAELQPDTVFFFLGINDISYMPLDEMITKYRTLVEKILAVKPNTRIIIMSATYPYPGTNKGGLNGDNVAAYNRRLEEMAQAEGWGFIDIAATSKGDGNFMKPELSSDKYVHVQFNVYNDWAKAVRAWAWHQISGE